MCGTAARLAKNGSKNCAKGNKGKNHTFSVGMSLQVCLGLLKSGEEVKNQEEVDRRKKQSLMFSRDIIPKPDIRLFTEHFLSSPTVVGVNINLNRISYAKVLKAEDDTYWLLLFQF